MYRKLLKVTVLHVLVASLIGASIVPFLPESFIDRILTPESYTVAGGEFLASASIFSRPGGTPSSITP